jgi:hypothetical protein
MTVLLKALRASEAPRTAHEESRLAQQHTENPKRHAKPKTSPKKATTLQHPGGREEFRKSPSSPEKNPGYPPRPQVIQDPKASKTY